jgi:hypothetical protein
MNSITYACCLSNHGIELLVSGESSRARKVFQSALSLLQEVVVREAETTTSCKNEMNISNDAASLFFYESTSTVSGLQDLQCYVYDHGIMISDDVIGDIDIDGTLSLYIAIVLFNLALATHSEGTALGRDKSLLKASVLYSLVAQILAGRTTSENMSTTILTLLALNNKAQIQYDQCEYVQYVDCIKQISMIMGSVDGLHSVLSHEAVGGLLRNVMLLITPTAAQAA